MAMPCPSCKAPLGLTLDFIIKNPVSVCPHCQVIMNFSASKIATDDLKKGLRQIEDLKKKYSNIAKFD
jgi:hypothetical protein